MRKLFTRYLPYFLILTSALLFYIPPLLRGKLPIPADSLVGLYHPWRDNSYNGFNPGKYPVKNPIITDPVLQTYPWRKAVVENFKNRQMPLWNPYSFSGQPLAANIQSAAFNPINILFLLLPFNFVWTLQIIAGTIFTSLFTYLFLKSLNLNKYAALYAAILLPFTAFFVSWMTWGTIIPTAAILPFLLYYLNKIHEKEKPSHFLMLTLGFCALTLLGHFQTALYSLIAVFLYALFIAIRDKKPKVFILATISFAVACLVLSPQLLPTLEFAQLSNRAADQNYFSGREDWFIPIKHLIQIISPDFFGNPATYNYWGVWNYMEFVTFIGIIPLFFAVFALTRINKTALFFIILVALSLLLGLENPISKIPFMLNLPVISSLQPSRIIFLLTIGLVVLSAFGLEEFLDKKFGRRVVFCLLLIFIPLIILLLSTYFFASLFPLVKDVSTSHVARRNLVFPIFTFITLLLIIVLKRQALRKDLLFVTILILSIFELLRFTFKLTPYSFGNIIYPRTQTTDLLASQPRPFRVMATDRRIANPNSLTPYKIESISGYDPLYLKKYARFVDAWESSTVNDNKLSLNRFVTPSKYNSQIADLMNVEYVLSFDELKNPKLEKVLTEGETKVYKNKNAFPRAFLVNQIESKPSESEVLKSIINSSTLNEIAYTTNYSFNGGDKTSRAQILNYSDQSITIKTEAKKDTPLIISNVYYPGWKAFVDGQEQEIKEVNYLMMAVIVPSGAHTTIITYKPDLFYKSLYLTSAGLVILFFYSVILWRKSRS